MKTKFIRNAAILSTAVMLTTLSASPGAMFGIGYSFGGGSDGIALTLKVLSSNDENKGIASLGVSYYPLAKANSFGIDVGGGYLFEDFALTGSWDFLQMKPQISGGYVNTMSDSNGAVTSGTPAPPPVVEDPVYEGGG